MKFSTLVIYCAVFILRYKGVDGGLVQNFLEKVREDTQRVQNDLSEILHMNRHGDKEAKPGALGEKKLGEETPNNKEKLKDPEIKHREGSEKAPVHEPTASSTTISVLSTDSNTNILYIDTTTVKEGRENFKANCRPGFQRVGNVCEKVKTEGPCRPGFQKERNECMEVELL